MAEHYDTITFLANTLRIYFLMPKINLDVLKLSLLLHSSREITTHDIHSWVKLLTLAGEGEAFGPRKLAEAMRCNQKMLCMAIQVGLRYMQR